MIQTITTVVYYGETIVPISEFIQLIFRFNTYVQLFNINQVNFLIYNEIRLHTQSIIIPLQNTLSVYRLIICFFQTKF